MIGANSSIESPRQGATDDIRKKQRTRLIPAVSRALREPGPQRRDEAAMAVLAHDRRLLGGIVAALPDFVYAVDRNNRIIACDPRAS